MSEMGIPPSERVRSRGYRPGAGTSGETDEDKA